MKSVCFAIHPSYYLTEATFLFYNILLETAGIAKLGNKIVFKRETDIRAIILVKTCL